MRPQDDSGSPASDPMSTGIRWASRVSTVGLEFALPPVLGVYLDRLWKTAPLCTLIGAFLGFSVGMLQILGIAREEAARSKK